MNTVKNLFAYISTIEKAKALHKSSRYIYCLLMDHQFDLLWLSYWHV